MGYLRIFTLTLITFTYCVMCNCKMFSQNSYQIRASPNPLRHPLAAIHRQQLSAYTTGHLYHRAPEKRSEKYESLVEYPSTEVTDSANIVLDRMPSNDYNRIVSALKEMLRARDEKPVLLRPRPGRRSSEGDFPLWQYFIDDAGNIGLSDADTVAIVDGVGDGLTDGSLKKSAPFKPRLGKRGEGQIFE